MIKSQHEISIEHKLFWLSSRFKPLVKDSLVWGAPASIYPEKEHLHV